MRKLTAGLFHSLDGVVEAPNLWQFDAFDDELGASLGASIAATDTVLLGRVGYEAWAKDFGEGDDDRRFEIRAERCDASECDGILARETRFDPDLWLVELEADDVADLFQIGSSEPRG